MIIRYYCDNCKKEIHGNYARIRVERRVIINQENPEPDMYYPGATVEYADICSECYSFLSTKWHILPTMPDREVYE